MIVIMGHAQLAPGDIDRLHNEIAAQLAATRAEDGCISYSFSRDVLDPDLLLISERWRDQAAIDAHFKSAHMAAFNAALGTVTVSSLRVAAYDAGEERILMGG